MLFEPNPSQARLLAAVQNLAHADQQLIKQARTAGRGLDAGALAHLEDGRRARENLEEVALAVGVPKSVIDYSRAAGERGRRWTPAQPLLSTETIDRDTLLTRHALAVAHLQTTAAIGAAVARSGSISREGFDAFRRAMGMSWQRLGAIGHVLDLNSAERERTWQPTTTPWASKAADTVNRWDTAELRQRWTEIVQVDFVTLSMPVLVLQAAGVTPDDIAVQLPVLPDRMVELVATALPSAAGHVEIPGAGIDAAIEATASDRHTDPGHDQVIEIEPRHGRGHDIGPDR